MSIDIDSSFLRLNWLEDESGLVSVSAAELDGGEGGSNGEIGRDWRAA